VAYFQSATASGGQRAAAAVIRSQRDRWSCLGSPADHGQLFQAAIQVRNVGHAEAAVQLWGESQAVWSRAWAANHTALALVQLWASRHLAGLARLGRVSLTLPPLPMRTAFWQLVL
jgi:hypothetical protein